MKHSIFALLLAGVVMLVIQSCDSSTTQPIDNDNPGDGKPIDSSFAIFSLERDLLYWGETGRIVGRGFGESADSLQLFVHTHGFTIVSVSDTDLVFAVPESAESGTFRLHRGARQADGSVSIVIIPQRVDAYPVVYDYEPKRGYPGEMLVITGNNLIQKLSDIDVWIADKKLVVETMTSNTLLARIPLDVKSGEVRVRLRNYATPLGPFTRLEHQGAEQFKQPFKSLNLYIEGMVIFTLSHLNGDEKGTMMWEMRENISYLLEGLPLTIKGDSLLLTSRRATSQDTAVIDLRFKLEPTTSELSGVVSIEESVRASNHYQKTKTVLELTRAVIRDQGTDLEVRGVVPQPMNGMHIADITKVLLAADSSLMRFGSLDPRRGELKLTLVK